jgi:hypothetical protein
VISSARRNARSAIGWPKEIAAVQMESPHFSRSGGRPAAVSRSAPSHAGSAGIVEAGRLGGVAVQRDHRRVIELAGLVQIVDGPGEHGRYLAGAAEARERQIAAPGRLWTTARPWRASVAAPRRVAELFYADTARSRRHVSCG